MKLYTFADANQDALDVVASNTTTTERRYARRAVFDALREIANVTHWTYYTKIGRLTTTGSYTTGTVTYNSTTRVLTLTNGTWPSWAAQGDVILNNVTYPVVTRTSGTEV